VVSISFREKCLPDNFVKRGLSYLRVVGVSISFREKCLPDGLIRDLLQRVCRTCFHLFQREVPSWRGALQRISWPIEGKQVSISFREKCLPDFNNSNLFYMLHFTQFPSLSERSAFLTVDIYLTSHTMKRLVSISFREKCLPDGINSVYRVYCKNGFHLFQREVPSWLEEPEQVVKFINE